MTNKKKKAPAKSGGYSYDKVVKNKDKNGKDIFFRYEGKKKIRTSAAEYQKVKDTKKYFKTKYKTDWQKKYKSAQNQFKDLDKQQKKIDKVEAQKRIKDEQSKNKVAESFPRIFANSMPTEVETLTLRFGSVDISFNGKVKKITNKNLLDARLFFSEVADVFYERWHEAKEAGREVNTPQVTYVIHLKATEIFKTKEIINEITVLLDKTTFSFDSKYFFQLLNRLFKTYFG